MLIAVDGSYAIASLASLGYDVSTAVDGRDAIAPERPFDQRYLKKGMLVLLEGRLAIRSYESKAGEKHKAAEIVLASLQMLARATNGGARDAGAPSATEVDALI